MKYEAYRLRYFLTPFKCCPHTRQCCCLMPFGKHLYSLKCSTMQRTWDAVEILLSSFILHQSYWPKMFLEAFSALPLSSLWCCFIALAVVESLSPAYSCSLLLEFCQKVYSFIQAFTFFKFLYIQTLNLYPMK